MTSNSDPLKYTNAELQDPIKRRLYLKALMKEIHGAIESFDHIVLDGDPSNLIDNHIAKTLAALNTSIQTLLSIGVQRMGITQDAWLEATIKETISLAAYVNREADKRKDQGN